MSISINQKKCQGCKACVEVCPGNLIQINDQGKAYIRDVRDCWGCTSCLKECRFHAISFFLGADIGGNGSIMDYEEKGDFAYWHVYRPGAENHKKTIVINKKESNKY